MLRAVRVCASLVGILLAISLAAPAVAASDPWNPIWRRTFDPNGNTLVGPPVRAIASDAAGNVFATGTIGMNDGWSAMILVKYAADGELLWQRTWRAMSGFHRHTIGFAVAVSPGGRTVYVGGAQLNDSTEEAISRVWSYTSVGDWRWSRVAWPSSTVVRAVLARPSGVVAAGSTHGELGPLNGLLAAFAADGARRWRDDFDVRARSRLTDVVHGLALDSAGRIYAVGSQDTERDIGPPGAVPRDAVIQQRSATGEVLWTRVLRDPGVRDWDDALAVDASGVRIFVAGQRDAWRERPGRAWLMRLSPSGAIRWQRVWGPPPPVGATAVGVSIAPGGGLYVVGRAGTAMVLRRLSLAGDLVSERRRDHTVPTGVTNGEGGGLYASGDASVWRMPA